ncbi:hypothetical protein DK880_00951 [Candidatus Cardinium hertigii]|uniref:DUF3575 domain-containing protein n=1 Tax=Candidatus Cardinium hertigii TaxID=247481 RepID=A0A2Z3L9R0_9BACT|nr:hypothetical protein DK880_00951 [Candidatus Cardinium hertigii]
MLYLRVLCCCFLTHTLIGSIAVLGNTTPPIENTTPPIGNATKTEPSAQETDTEATEVPLVKTVPKNAMESLQSLFIPQTIQTALYSPLLQHIGIRLNYLGLLCCIGEKKGYYEGGVDVYCRGNIACALDMGYARYSKDTSTPPTKHTVQQGYATGLLQYVMQPNPITHAYVGIGYGQQFVNKVHWAKLILGSECKLFRRMPALYGGMQLGLTFPWSQHSAQPIDMPGHIILHGINLGLTFYLKWNWTFLEKR